MAEKKKHRMDEVGEASGISNRESPSEEAIERDQNPPLDATSLPPEDPAGPVDEESRPLSKSRGHDR